MRVGTASRNHPRYHRAVDRAVDDRRTDLGLWMELNGRFHFTIDAAASAENAMLPRYWTREQDALKQSWAGERVWCNPPYSDPEPWISKAWLAQLAPAAELVVLLLPNNRTEQGWWQELVEPHRDRGHQLRTEFLPGRPRFTRPDGVAGRPFFGLVLLVWETRT